MENWEILHYASLHSEWQVYEAFGGEGSGEAAPFSPSP